jgi:hypothetical protein
LGNWVKRQRRTSCRQGKTSYMTELRIQEFKANFRWDPFGLPGKPLRACRLSRIHGHCVPKLQRKVLVGGSIAKGPITDYQEGRRRLTTFRRNWKLGFRMGLTALSGMSV